MPSLDDMKDLKLRSTKRVSGQNLRQTGLREREKRLVSNERETVAVDESDASALEFIERVKRRDVVNCAHVFHVQNRLEVVRDGMLQRHESVFVRTPQ